MIRSQILVFVFLTLNFCGAGQVINLLELTKEKFYKERNFFFADTSSRFTTVVFYNDPRRIDEEFIHLVNFSASSLSQNGCNRTFNVNSDFCPVKCYYNRLSVWHWKQDTSAKVTGTLTILKVKKRWVRMNLDIHINDVKRNETYNYIGKRKFYRVRKNRKEYYI